MATSITHALGHIKDELSAHVAPENIHEACLPSGHQWHDRVLGPVLTVQALLLQIVHATAITGVSRLIGVSFSASTYCRALQRLPVEVMRGLLRQFVLTRDSHLFLSPSSVHKSVTVPS